MNETIFSARGGIDAFVVCLRTSSPASAADVAFARLAAALEEHVNRNNPYVMRYFRYLKNHPLSPSP